MSEKKVHKQHKKDQVKPSHREAFKGHRTRKHYLAEVQMEEADEEIDRARDKRRFADYGE